VVTGEPRQAVTSARPRRPLRARPRRLKRRARGVGLWPRLRALNGSVPYPVRMTLEQPEPQARKNLTLEECDYRSVASKPAQCERAPQVPPIYKNYRSMVRGPAWLKTLETCRCEKTGALSCHPATALLIRGLKPALEGFEQAPQITRVRDDEGAHSSLSSSPPARGCPTCRVREPARAASRGGSHRGRASAPSVPSERDRAPPSKPTQAL
jgi:hypothetical protein